MFYLLSIVGITDAVFIPVCDCKGSKKMRTCKNSSSENKGKVHCSLLSRQKTRLEANNPEDIFLLRIKFVSLPSVREIRTE
jgi:hypothetical protein